MSDADVTAMEEHMGREETEDEYNERMKKEKATEYFEEWKEDRELAIKVLEGELTNNTEAHIGEKEHLHETIIGAMIQFAGLYKAKKDATNRGNISKFAKDLADLHYPNLPNAIIDVPYRENRMKALERQVIELSGNITLKDTLTVVCEWKPVTDTGWNLIGYTTSCANNDRHKMVGIDYKYCPHCGKKVKKV